MAIVGGVCHTDLSPHQGTHPTDTACILCSVIWKVMNPSTPPRVDVLLEPSIQAAERTIEMLHIWGEPVLIKDIPITWED